MGEDNVIKAGKWPATTTVTAAGESMPSAFSSQESFVVFKAAGVSLGLKVAHVSRVIPRVALSKAPEMPPVIEGFLELSGDWIPVLNLCYLLGKSLAGDSDILGVGAIHEQIIIARYADKMIAWRCEEGTKIIQATKSDVIELPRDHVLNNCAAWTLTRPDGRPGIVILEPELLLLQEEEVRMKELAGRLAQRKTLAAQGSV